MDATDDTEKRRAELVRELEALARDPARKLGAPMLSTANTGAEPPRPGAGGWTPGNWVAPVVAISGAAVLAAVPFVTGVVAFSPGALAGAILTALVTGAFGWLGITSAGPRR